MPSHWTCWFCHSENDIEATHCGHCDQSYEDSEKRWRYQEKFPGRPMHENKYPLPAGLTQS